MLCEVSNEAALAVARQEEIRVTHYRLGEDLTIGRARMVGSQ